MTVGGERVPGGYRRDHARQAGESTGDRAGDTVNVVYDEAKLVEMILYVAARLQDDRAGGATKLNKVLYFADFGHMRRTGVPISGADYQKLPHGPAPRRLLPLRNRLLATGAARLVTDGSLGQARHVLAPARPADTSVFTDDELATIDQVLDELAGLTATQVSDLSHDEPGWRLADERATIPYETAFIAKVQASTPASRRLAESVAHRYGIVAP